MKIEFSSPGREKLMAAVTSRANQQLVIHVEQNLHAGEQETPCGTRPSDKAQGEGKGGGGGGAVIQTLR